MYKTQQYIISVALFCLTGLNCIRVDLQTDKYQEEVYNQFYGFFIGFSILFMLILILHPKNPND